MTNSPNPISPHPTQPIIVDEQGVRRYKANEIVRYLLDEGGIDLNMLAEMNFSNEDHWQFAQLIGYSESGAGDLSYAPEPEPVTSPSPEEREPQPIASTGTIISEAKGLMKVASRMIWAWHHGLRIGRDDAEDGSAYIMRLAYALGILPEINGSSYRKFSEQLTGLTYSNSSPLSQPSAPSVSQAPKPYDLNSATPAGLPLTTGVEADQLVIRTAPPETQRWIAVSEYLPEIRRSVLVNAERYAWSNSGKTLQLADKWIQIASLRSDGVWIDDDGTFARDLKDRRTEHRRVTHWQPLTFPPSPATDKEK